MVWWLWINVYALFPGEWVLEGPVDYLDCIIYPSENLAKAAKLLARRVNQWPLWPRVHIKFMVCSQQKQYVHFFMKTNSQATLEN